MEDTVDNKSATAYVTHIEKRAKPLAQGLEIDKSSLSDEKKDFLRNFLRCVYYKEILRRQVLGKYPGVTIVGDAFVFEVKILETRFFVTWPVEKLLCLSDDSVKVIPKDTHENIVFTMLGRGFHDFFYKG